MNVSEKVLILLRRRNMKSSELAEKLGTTPQNFSNKMKRANFSEKEIQQIAEALDCKVDVAFTMNDSGESI